MRLFIAVDLDAEARAAIAAEQRRLGEAAGSPADRSLRWVRAEQIHLTLVFLGEIADARAPAIVDVIERPVRQRPFDLTFAGIGVFPPRAAARVLWLGTVEGAEALAALERELATRIGRCGIVLEERPFRPHLTLARWREGWPADRTRLLAAARPDAIARVRVDHATLYQSRLSSAGPSYTALARATLFA